MSNFHFGYNEENYRDYYPVYADIDWHSAYISKHKTEPLSVWMETEDGGIFYCEQLHQENCAIYLNNTNDDFDVIVVANNESEDTDFWITREQVGSEKFNYLLDSIGEEVMVIHTKYPLQKIAEYISKSFIQSIFDE